MEPTERATRPRAPRASILARIGLLTLTTVAALAAAEVGLQIFWRHRHGKWLSEQSSLNPDRGFFRYHPFLGVSLQPGWHATDAGSGVTITIQDDGTRSLGDAGALAPADAPAVVCTGGSSTFCGGITDSQTWPSELQRVLGADARVVNLGHPGYSTVENVIQTAFDVPEHAPRVCVYYVGWNDVQSMHVRPLDPMYAEFHGRSVLTSLGIVPPGAPPSRSAIVTYARTAFPGLGASADPFAGFRVRVPQDSTTTDAIDARALALYRRNLETLTDLCRARNQQVVFVPQILNYSRLTGDGCYGWAPHMRDGYWKTAMAEYNAALRDVSERDGVRFVDAMLTHEWTDADFLDVGHFSAGGSRRFAEILAPVVRDALRAAR